MRKQLALSLVTGFLVSVALTGCQPNVTPPSATPNIQSTIDLAKKTSDYTERDTMLTSAVNQAKSVGDIMALAKSCYFQTDRDQLLMQGVNLAQGAEDFKTLALACSSQAIRDQLLMQGVSSCKSVDEIVSLAKSCSSHANRDNILLQGTKLASTNADYTKLATACSSQNNRDRILSRAAEGSVNVTQPASDQLNKAYKDMQAAYTAYQKGLSDKASNTEIKRLAEDYKAKKATYDSLIKK